MTFSKERKKAAFIFTMGAAILLFIAFVEPTDDSVYPDCFYKWLTGYDCAYCGSTRGTYDFFHGDFQGMLDANVLLIIILPLVIYGTVRAGLLALFDKRIPPVPKPTWLIVVGVIIMFAFWILRNLPYEPFLWLKPN
jgi:hypothetical protein